MCKSLRVPRHTDVLHTLPVANSGWFPRSHLTLVASVSAQLIHLSGGADRVAEMTGRKGGTALDEETGKGVYYARNQTASSFCTNRCLP